MIKERPVHANLRSLLIENDPFQYAHLVKFERPSRPDAVTGKVSTSRERYTYLTDASRDVLFDDGSTTLAGQANGPQMYLANKLVNISGVAEQTEAKASSYSITLDGNSIGAYVTSTATISVAQSGVYDIQWPANVDILEAGFREGDKVKLTGVSSGEYNIHSFRANNVLRLLKIDTDITVGTGTVNMGLSSEEIKSILLDKNAEGYSSFINREVFLYRAYFDEGEIVGLPVMLFKGIISNVSFEDADEGIKVTWGLTSHWGDFAQVKGRVTSDDFHRALNENGIPQPESALKTEYAYDKGFQHAETSINLLSQYLVPVEKQEVKAKSGFLGLGIGSKVKVKKYIVQEERTTELDFQLQAKSIPVAYGVRNLKGIPIFADTLKNDSSQVYVVYALCEGEIGGIYDVLVNGSSLICSDKADFDARSVQTQDDTVEIVCRGRADRGDVLGGTSSVSTVAIDYYENIGDLYGAFNYNPIFLNNYQAYIPPVITTTNTEGKGIIDGESIKLTSPLTISLDVFSGKPGQKAASSLVSIAQQVNFKIQSDYWSDTDTPEYWGPNHRLLDTAYIVGQFKIAEGETTIPELEFIVRTKNIECYNYDYSYSHYDKASSENESNFALGDYVTLYNEAGQALTGQIQIVDKWTFMNPDGTANTRFRYNVPPPLGYVNGVPSITKFYMQNAGGQKWTMITFNYTEYTGTVGTAIESPVTSVSNNGGQLNIGYLNNPYMTYGGDPYEPSPVYSVYNNQRSHINVGRLVNAVLSGNTSSSSLTTKYPFTNVSAAAPTYVGGIIASRNTLALSTDSSATNNYYNGQLITVTRYDSNTDKEMSQTREVISYNSSTRVITIDGLWDIGFSPKAGDTVVIRPKYADKRVSINPAMQVMDYITSKTYGRGLDAYKDLDIPSWLEAGRECDTQSNVTVKLSDVSSLPSQGGIYEWRVGGKLIWQGTVVGDDLRYVEFRDVLGKLTYAWNNWRSYSVGELIHIENRLYQVTVAGSKTTKPTHNAGTVGGLTLLTALNITKTSGPGPATLGLLVAGNPIRALRDGSEISGYSLYDADGVNYWRHLGWDEFNQRYVTRHQTNLTIDTSLPLFDNVNSLLEHFGGILRYTLGKWYLEVEDSEGPIETEDDEVRNITADHIIGKIRLNDEGVRGAYNSLTAAYADPANKFEPRNISFFNSNYLKADRNVPRKGSVSVPGITNYYNTRILADKFLSRSRFGLTISFNMAPRGVLLLAGTVIQVQYPRYDWIDKKFRITTITHQPDASVDVVAEEYDDSFYVLSKISKQAGSGLAGFANQTSIAPPSGLKATSLEAGDEIFSGVSVFWMNNPLANATNMSTELYASYSSQMIITVDSINANVLTTLVPHELRVGEQITSMATLNGLIFNGTYFVKETPTPTTFTLSESKDGPLKGFPNGSSLQLEMNTASLIATLPVPINSFTDVFGGINGRVVKYYWVRHKVIKG